MLVPVSKEGAVVVDESEFGSTAGKVVVAVVDVATTGEDVAVLDDVVAADVVVFDVSVIGATFEEVLVVLFTAEEVFVVV